MNHTALQWNANLPIPNRDISKVILQFQQARIPLPRFPSTQRRGTTGVCFYSMNNNGLCDQEKCGKFKFVHIDPKEEPWQSQTDWTDFKIFLNHEEVAKAIQPTLALTAAMGPL